MSGAGLQRRIKLRRVTGWLVGGMLAMASAAQALTCPVPGKDGVGAGITGVVNTYYPGTASSAAGATSLSLGTSRGAATQITVGDLLLVMQMQDATLNTNNTTAYGAGTTTASGATAINAGKYEYVVATSASGGNGTVTFRGDGAGGGLINSYTDSAYTATSGAKRFQIIRVPQYSSATLGAALAPSAWDGTSGGVLAIDVAGGLNLNGGAITATGLGFRGGGGRQLRGGTGGTGTDYVNLSTNAFHGQKGEGVAGSPRYINNAGTVLDTTVEGYPNGSSARGAPANAGGGATDANPTANDQNSGGGGGAGGGAGGKGGNAWSSAATTGGLGGTVVPFGVTQMMLGGGGGAGSINDGTGTPAGGPAAGGAAGGGLVMIRANTVTGSGTITADGAAANNTVTNDGSGGGGAGGSVMVISPNILPGTLTINARGGTGGTNTGGGAPHGPGGGGGGGAVVLSGTGPAVTLTGGLAGTTAGTPANYGAVAGSNGTQVTTATPATVPGAASGATCRPVLTVAKSTSTPLRTNGTDTTAIYTVTVSNSGATSGGVVGASVTDPLPSPFTYNGAVITPVYSAGASGPASVTGSGTTTAVFGTAGDSTNGFFIPQGGSVALTFTVTLNSPASGTYQNPANVNFSDPTRTTAGAFVSPGGTYVGGGTVGGSNYASASSTAEDVVVNNPPTTANVTNVLLVNTAGATVLNPNLSATDTDGTVASYTIATLPAVASGVLSVNGAAVTAGQTFTAAQLGTLTFAPKVGYSGTASFTYTATDNQGAVSNTSTYSIPVNNPPTTKNVTNVVLVNTAGATVLNPNLSATDTDGTIASYTIVTLPSAASGVLSVNGAAATVGQTFTAAQLGTLSFAPKAGFSGNATFTYSATDNQGAVSNTSTYTVPVNNPPTTVNVTNAVLLDTAAATVLSTNLSATDTDGTIASYTIVTLPAAASGVLSVNGAAATVGQTFTAAQLGTLSFAPKAGFNGTASFTYSATDNQGAVSNTSTYSIPVNVAPVAVNDTTSTPANTAKTFSITGNDTDTAPGTVNAASTVFTTAGQPSGATVSNGNRTITVPGEGSYTLDNTGNVTFTPVAGYSGTTTAVKYTVNDNQGAVSNVATITVNVPASVDLAISKVGPAYFKPGDTLSYTLTVTNSGSVASGVTVIDTLPSGLTFASASGGGTYSATTGKVTWTLGNVANGSATTLTLTGTAATAASVETNSGPTSLANTATTQGNETEVVTSNNSATSTAQLVYPKLSKRVRNVTQGGTFSTSGTGKPGEVLEYCIDFKNYGVTVAAFVISDSVPSNTNANLSAYGAGLGLQVLRNNATTTRTSSNADGDGGSLSSAALSLDLGSLAAGESGSVCFQAGIK